MSQALLLLGIAERLITKWKPTLAPDRTGLLPDPNELAAGLARLLIQNIDLEKIIEDETDPKKIKLELWEDAIKVFQRTIGALRVDGILGKKTLSDLLTAIACLKNLPISTTEVSEEFKKLVEQKRTNDGENWYLYYVESLPQVPGADVPDVIVENAWSLWQEFANVKVERLPDSLKSAANVIIKTANLSGGILGRANVGNPPGKFVLEIEMDSSRTWDPELFEGAVAHEIGHVLGLEHLASPGFLMSEVVPRDWRGRMEKDGLRAADLSWLGPAPVISTGPRRRGRFDALRPAE